MSSPHLEGLQPRMHLQENRCRISRTVADQSEHRQVRKDRRTHLDLYRPKDQTLGRCAQIFSKKHSSLYPPSEERHHLKFKMPTWSLQTFLHFRPHSLLSHIMYIWKKKNCEPSSLEPADGKIIATFKLNFFSSPDTFIVVISFCWYFVELLSARRPSGQKNQVFLARKTKNSNLPNRLSHVAKHLIT